MKPQEFKSRYVHTLQTDPETKKSYIKIPITDLYELGSMHESLIHGIKVLAQADEHSPRDIGDSIYWLCRVLSAGYPIDELEGLSELLKG